ncbi:MAG: ABC transporter permease [Proteobacteria bacterium]|nr:ABC transporter permease [Pseudomonadota bacterium]
MAAPLPAEIAAAPRRRRLPLQLKTGGCIALVIVLSALLAPLVAPYPYDQMHVQHRFEPPSASFWLGTDEFGRDVFSRVLLGGQLSLFMGVLATTICLALGVPVGLAAGFFRGRIDELLMRAADVLMSIPAIMLALLILAVFKPSLWMTGLAVGIVYVPPMARITRSMTLALMEEEFIVAARARGESVPYILFAEILPSAWPPIIVEGSLRVTYAILLGSALSFLGLGAQPPSSDWGLMISEARTFIDQAPWIALAPGIAMCSLVIAVNLVGDGLREVLDPRVRHRGRA